MALQRDIAASGFSGAAAKAIVGSVAQTFTAAGATQATATAIGASKTYITAGSAFNGAILPGSMGVGDSFEICNSLAVNICIYPPVGYALNGSTVNVPLVIPPHFTAVCSCIDGNNYMVS